MTQTSSISSFQAAAPFWLSLLAIPIAILAAVNGGLWVLALPVFSWVLFSFLDVVTGVYEGNADPDTPDEDIFWYKLITILWAPLQFAALFWLIWYVSGASHLGTFEKIFVFFGVGVLTGTVGIN